MTPTHVPTHKRANHVKSMPAGVDDRPCAWCRDTDGSRPGMCHDCATIFQQPTSIQRVCKAIQLYGIAIRRGHDPHDSMVRALKWVRLEYDR